MTGLTNHTTEAGLDLDALGAWIGRSETADDLITPRLERSLRAVLDEAPGAPVAGDLATPTVHWCLTPAIVPMAKLGEDGHPRRGGFLPPVPLPRRMWAGGALTFHDPLRVGDPVTRTSTIADVVVKHGRSGPLCFVTVRHVFATPRGRAVEERQDIVYRDATGASPGLAKAATAEPPLVAQQAWRCDPVRLFRYSAVTFNGHRIHYDRTYAQPVEGYRDLVVHGPLQAKALLDLATAARGSLPRSFAFRGVSPLFAATDARLNAAADGEDLALWIADGDGRITMQATASWHLDYTSKL